jgi:hypothetical protein
MTNCHERYGFSGTEGEIKHPAVFAGLLSEAKDRNLSVRTLEHISRKIAQIVDQL